MELEMKQLGDFTTFNELGLHTEVPEGFKNIRVYLILDVKHDGRHKARLVADGHLMDIPVNTVYSGEVSLRGIRLLLFIAELNKLQVWSTDIGNAYLQAKMKEKVCFIAEPEFKDREGHLLTIHKALVVCSRFSSLSILGLFPDML